MADYQVNEILTLDQERLQIWMQVLSRPAGVIIEQNSPEAAANMLNEAQKVQEARAIRYRSAEIGIEGVFDLASLLSNL